MAGQLNNRKVKIRELMAAVRNYETAVVGGESKEKMAREFFKETGFDIEALMARQRAIGGDGLRGLREIGISEAVVKRAAIIAMMRERMMVERLAEMIGGGEEAENLARVVVKMAAEEAGRVKMDLGKLRRMAMRMMKKRKITGEGLTELADETVEISAKIRVQAELEEEARVMVGKLEEAGLSEMADQGELNEIVESAVKEWGVEGKPMSVVGLEGEILRAVGKAGDGAAEGMVGRAVKGAEAKIDNLRKINREAYDVEEDRYLREKINKIVGEANFGVDEEIIDDYARLVSGFYKNNPVKAFKNEAEAEAVRVEVSPGRFEAGFKETMVVHHLLENGLGDNLERFSALSKLIPNLSSSNIIDECRTVNGMMRAFSQSPELAGELRQARRNMAVMQNVRNFLRPGGVDRMVLNLSSKVGRQSLVNFVQQTSILMAQGKNLGQAMGTVFKAMMTTGKVVVTGAAKTAATGAAAGVAGTATGTGLAALVSGSLAPIVAAVGAVWTVVKPILKKVKKIAEKLGLSLGAKKWLKDNLGNIPGAILGFGADAAVIVIGLGGVMMAGVAGAAIALVGPVVIGLFGWNFAYHMFQSSQISSLVPPLGIGGGEEMYIKTGVAVDDLPLPEWSTTLELPESCPKGFPVSKGIITQGPGAKKCSHRNMTNAVDIALSTGNKIKATHDGIIRASANRIYGYFVDIRAKCEGEILVTRYAHLKEAMDYDGNQKISAGEVIGRVNNTGSSTNPHIHYDIRGRLPNYFESYLDSKIVKDALTGCCNVKEGISCPAIFVYNK